MEGIDRFLKTFATEIERKWKDIKVGLLKKMCYLLQ